MSLADLETRVRADLDMLATPGPGWVRPRTHASGTHIYDVAIVGGGQSGLSAAFGLLRERVDNIIVLDENTPGREGPWGVYARMATLRTPKHLTGPDLGIPSLTFRAWWEAQHGADGWATLEKIPRTAWMEFLQWFRRVLALPVRNAARVTAITPADGLHRLDVEGANAVLARKVVLATGIQGGGQWHVPAFVRDALPSSLYAHTADAIDYAARAGQRIAILGGGASAFDNAQHALGQGVAEAHVFIRRADLQRINPIRFMEGAGLTKHFARLDDGEKYAVVDHFLRLNQPPTNDMFAAACGYPGFHLHTGAPWESVSAHGAGVRVTTPSGAMDFDFLVLSTGLLTDLSLRPELAAVAGDILLWRDRHTPAQANPLIDAHPYLGPGFQLLPRTPEAASRLHGLFLFNYAALATFGISASALSGMKHALPRLIDGVTGELFLDDRAAILDGYARYADEEFTGRWPGADT